MKFFYLEKLNILCIINFITVRRIKQTWLSQWLLSVLFKRERENLCQQSRWIIYNHFDSNPFIYSTNIYKASINRVYVTARHYLKQKGQSNKYIQGCAFRELLVWSHDKVHWKQCSRTRAEKIWLPQLSSELQWSWRYSHLAICKIWWSEIGVKKIICCPYVCFPTSPHTNS